MSEKHIFWNITVMYNLSTAIKKNDRKKIACSGLGNLQHGLLLGKQKQNTQPNQNPTVQT